jgi:hypothetical protein
MGQQEEYLKQFKQSIKDAKRLLSMLNRSQSVNGAEKRFLNIKIHLSKKPNPKRPNQDTITSDRALRR